MLNNSMEVLGSWASDDDALREWVLPHPERLVTDARKSVAKKAGRWLERLTD